MEPLDSMAMFWQLWAGMNAAVLMLAPALIGVKGLSFLTKTQYLEVMILELLT